MTCEQVREQLGEHVLGTNGDGEAQEVRRHLRGCMSCRQEFRQLDEGMSTFARAAHQVDPPQDLRERVLGVWEAEREEAGPSRGGRISRSTLARAAVAAALAGALAWGAVETQRAAEFRGRADHYEEFLGVLGGKDVRVGTLRAEGSQAVEGSAVFYDSTKGQSWVLILVRAPGAEGKARVVISSPKREIELFPLRFEKGGEASSWLVTGADISRFDRVSIFEPDGGLMASGRVSGD